MATDADHPTRTLPLTRTLWGDLWLDAVACEGSRLIRPKGDAVDGEWAFQNSRTQVYILFFVERGNFAVNSGGAKNRYFLVL